MNEGGLSFAAKVEKLFAGKDHVGVVKHYESVEMESFSKLVDELLNEMGLKHDYAMEVIRDKLVYNCVSILNENNKIYLWIRATRVEIGLITEIRIYHPTEFSGYSDELLSKLVENIEKRIFTLQL